MSSNSPFRDLIADCQGIKSSLNILIGDHGIRNPSWVTDVDARAAGLQDFLNVVRATELTLIFIEDSLTSPGWWLKIRGEQPPIRTVSFEFTAYTEISKFGIHHVSISCLENAFRCLLRAIAPSAAKNGRAEFKSIYESLLRSQLQFPDEDLAFMELLRLSRNTTHNLGIQKAPFARSETISVRGTEYAFTDGQPIEFVTWAFVLQQIRDMVELLDRVLNSPQISGYKGIIPAEWAVVLPPDA